MAPRDPTHHIFEGACDLLQAARDIEEGVEGGGVIEAVPATLGTIEGALRVLSASCYRLAADAAGERLLSRENEAHLMATLHDVASSIAQGSRACRAGREVVAPLIARKVNAARQLDSTDERAKVADGGHATARWATGKSFASHTARVPNQGGLPTEAREPSQLHHS